MYIVLHWTDELDMLDLSIVREKDTDSPVVFDTYEDAIDHCHQANYPAYRIVLIDDYNH